MAGFFFKQRLETLFSAVWIYDVGSLKKCCWLEKKMNEKSNKGKNLVQKRKLLKRKQMLKSGVLT